MGMPINMRACSHTDGTAGPGAGIVQEECKVALRSMAQFENRPGDQLLTCIMHSHVTSRCRLPHTPP